MVSKILFRIISRGLLHPWFRLTRAITLGVRCVVFNERGEVFLVRHGYSPGWQLPGGGVEAGETAYAAVCRELGEEGGIIPDEAPQLHGLFANESQFRGDHIACFVLRRFHRADWKPSLEIREAGFFDAYRLPEATTGGTVRRINEILNRLAPSQTW